MLAEREGSNGRKKAALAASRKLRRSEVKRQKLWRKQRVRLSVTRRMTEY
jgi:hypothetical protein